MIREVKEAWWHRLLLVIALAIILLGSAISIFLAWEYGKVTTYQYNWHAESRQLESPSDCTILLYPSIAEANFYCGEFRTTTAAVDDMLSRGFIAKAAQIPTPRTEYSDGMVLENINGNYPLKYEYSRAFPLRNSIKYGSYAVGAIFLIWLAICIVWKMIFFIAYGASHRIVK